MKEFDLKPRLLDLYIIKKFISTFFVALILIIGIVIIFDISEKIDDFVSKEAPLKAIVFDYYFNFIPYFMNMFSALFVFITVIFFKPVHHPQFEQGISQIRKQISQIEHK